MTVTYRAGYGTDRKTKAEMLAWSRFAGVDPEMQRRLFALMDAARAAGTDLGVGGGLRTTAEQEALFLSRHDAVVLGGCCSYKLRRYKLKSGVAHAAPPGRSYHEPTTPQGKCLAVDMVGWENGWLVKNCSRFGLIHFADINGEPWHLQPQECPESRSAYNPTLHVLKTFPLPSATVSPYGSYPTMTKPTVQAGSRNEYVTYLQRVLAEKAGQSITIDGYFGAQTATAVRNFQGFFGLTVDGIVAAKTWGAVDMIALK